MKKEDEIMKMFKWIEDHPNLGKVDVCIPNAGLSHDNKLIDGNISHQIKYNINLRKFLFIIFRNHGRMEVYVGC